MAAIKKDSRMESSKEIAYHLGQANMKKLMLKVKRRLVLINLKLVKKHLKILIDQQLNQYFLNQLQTDLLKLIIKTLTLEFLMNIKNKEKLKCQITNSHNNLQELKLEEHKVFYHT